MATAMEGVSGAQFALSAEIHGHGGPVRALCYLPDKVGAMDNSAVGGYCPIVSGSQDATGKVWLPKASEAAAGGGEAGGGVYFEMGPTLANHDHWVVATTAIPKRLKDKGVGGGASIITGSLDKKIRLFDNEGTCTRTLTGHEGGIISFSWTASGYLLSGSWDGTAKLWDLENGSGTCVGTLEGHENAVCVLGLPDGGMVTGSTGVQSGNGIVDFQIRLWGKDGQKKRSMKDHGAGVRCLDVMPGMGFMSTSNDGSVKLWSLEGDLLASMQHPPTREGHPTFVLGGCVLQGGGQEAVSVDESGVCMVWSGSEALQTIAHPASLWCCVALPNGDFATGCQDHVIRVFSRDPQRLAAADVIVAFDDAVKEAATQSQKGPSDAEVSKLPHWDRRNAKVGSSEGQVQLFQRDAKAIAAQWSSSSAAWVEIGEVTGSSSKESLDGQSYDHVFKIEVEAAAGQVQELQIGVNNGDNPFTTAQTFIDKHELPQSYLGQIADYISKRVQQPGGPMLGMEGGGGGGASGGGGGGASGGGGFDGVGDPTGFATSLPMPPSSLSSSKARAMSLKLLPHKVYTTFETGSLDKVVAKIRELSAASGAGGDDNPGCLSAAHTQALNSLSTTLSNTSLYHATEVTPAELRMLVHVVSKWPLEDVFPCIDLCRLAAVHPAGAKLMGGPTDGPNLVKAVLERCGEGRESVGVILCGIRFFVNLLKAATPRQLVMRFAPALLDTFAEHVGSTNKTIRLSLASLLLNLAVAVTSPEVERMALACRGGGGGGAGAYSGGDVPEYSEASVVQQLVAVIEEVLSSSTMEDDGKYRALVALGTLLAADSESSKVETVAKSTAADVEITNTIRSLSGSEFSEAAEEVIRCL